MKKALMMLILAGFLLATAGFVFGAEMAKEGSDTGKTGFTVTFQVLAQGKAYLQINYDARGVPMVENEASPFYGSSVQCIGSMKGIKGEIKEIGLCTYTRLDGDQIYASYEGTGKMGEGVKGSMAFVGGTGKCANLTGSLEWVRISLKGPSEKVHSSISKFSYNWKIPSGQ